LGELLALHGGTPRAHVFMPLDPGKRFSQLAQIAGRKVEVDGAAGGQCIIVDAGGDGGLYICGYRCSVKIYTPNAVYPLCKGVTAERGAYRDGRWNAERAVDIGLSQYEPYVSVSLPSPMAVRLTGV
jgi:hypothetical protein